jgi:subtilisin family serine protease
MSPIVSEPVKAQFHLDRAIDYSLGTQPNPADRRTAVYGANQEFQPAGSPGHPETPSDTRIDGFEGQGMNIAIIDSGVDYRHPMFGGIGLNTAVPRTSGQPASPNDNRKVIYFYAFNQPVGDPTDDFGHGTLVASNAAGYSVDGTTLPRLGYGTGVNPPQGVGPTPDGRQLFGTAPQARIMAYKVCGPAPNCFGDIELSMEDAASPVTLTGSGDGGSVPTMVSKPIADIINLSLGDTSGNPAGASSRAANNAALAGTLVVASAGNSGIPGRQGDGTIGAPSAATLAISVAAGLDPGSVAARMCWSLVRSRSRRGQRQRRAHRLKRVRHRTRMRLSRPSVKASGYSL